MSVRTGKDKTEKDATVILAEETFDAFTVPTSMAGPDAATAMQLTKAVVPAGNLEPEEPVNAALRVHATGVADWPYGDLSRTFYMWAERFNTTFSLDLVTPAVRIDREGLHTLGTYRRGRNGFGVRHEITLNVRHLDRSPAAVLETLLHELLHEWQQLHGRPGRGNYHNKQFREKARALGLVVDQYGHSLGVTDGPFRTLLAEHEVDMSLLPVPGQPPTANAEAGRSKLLKWTCGCTNVRAAVEVRARCLKCGQEFVLGCPRQRCGTERLEFKPESVRIRAVSEDGQAQSDSPESLAQNEPDGSEVLCTSVMLT